MIRLPILVRTNNIFIVFSIWIKSFNNKVSWTCLLYTSDAADDLLCVDLGGRRIIKKKKNNKKKKKEKLKTE